MLQAKHFQNPSTSSDNKPIHEYQDVVVFNNSTGDAQPIPLVYNQTKLTNVIDKSNDYYISVVRWSADSILPQIIPEMYLYEPPTTVPPPGDYSPNTPAYSGETNYIIGIRDSGQAYSCVRVIYNPVTNSSNNYARPALKPLSQNEYYNNPYYWISDIEEFVNCLNVALQRAQKDAAIVGSPTIPTIPLFYFNSQTGKIELLFPNKEYGQPTVSSPTNTNTWNPAVEPQLKMWMNTELYSLLNTFNATAVTTNPGVGITALEIYEPNGTNLELLTPFPQMYYINTQYNYGRNSYNNPIQSGGTIPIIDVVTQTNSSIPSMSPVTSIVFQTTSIPVNNTLTGAPAFLGPNLQANNALENNAGVLTDFQVPLSSGTEYSGSMLYYTPQSEYRLCDLISNSPTQVLNIVVYWLDQIGNYHPFLIKNQGSASLKLMFRKKSFNGTI